MFAVNFLFDVFSSDIFFYGCLFIIFARHFGLINLDEESSRIFNVLINFSAFVSVIHMIIRLSESIVKLFQSSLQ
jgi:hypothetical protein